MIFINGNDMKIKELSSAVELSISTIRYYEKLGLLNPKKQGYYKEYTEEIKEQLLEIKKLHLAGLSLTQIQILTTLNHKDKEELTRSELQLIESILESSILKVSSLQEQLKQSKKELAAMLKKVKQL